MKIIRKLTLLFTILIISGCGWIGILNADYCEDKENSFRIREETRRLDVEYRGAKYDEIKSVFGKPRKIKKEGKSLVITDKECAENWKGVMRWGDCELGKADEAWVYEYKERDKCGWVYYSRTITFLDGKVVEIR